MREAHIAQADDYEEDGPLGSPNRGVRTTFRTQGKGEPLVSGLLPHPTPHQHGMARFSPIDDKSEAALSPYASSRSPGIPHCALLFAADSLTARSLGGQDTVRVMQVGHSISETAGSFNTDTHAVFDRQVRVFGEEGQRRIEATRIAIVGLGGTGSVTAQQIAHLGARDFLLIDRDVVEETNLNRTVGSTLSDVGQPKVVIAKRLVEAVRTDAQVHAIVGDVVDQRVRPCPA